MNMIFSDKQLRRYIIGFVVSLGLTVFAYLIVTEDLLSGGKLGITLAALAGAQLIVQLAYFLHLGDEKKPHFHQTAFFYATITVFAIVAGSIWIMHNLQYNMMPMDSSTDKSIIEDEGYHTH